MASSTAKKVVIRRFEREPLSGFVNQLTFQDDTGVELLSLSGTVTLVPFADIKSVHFVRDFEGMAETGRREFLARPKVDGLWVRLEFRDGDHIEGVMANNLLQIERAGFMLTPPDHTSNNQRVFVPRAALRALQVLGVVGSPIGRTKKGKQQKEQIRLFE